MIRPQLFNVTWERVNEAEAEIGDTERRGMLRAGLRLREAVNAVWEYPDRGNDHLGVQANCSEPTSASWVTAHFREYRTGESIALSIHFPASTTPASRARLVRALSCYL